MEAEEETENLCFPLWVSLDHPLSLPRHLCSALTGVTSETMEVPPEMIAGVEGEFGRSGAPAPHWPRGPGKRQSPFVAESRASWERDLARAQKDFTMRTGAGL